MIPGPAAAQPSDPAVEALLKRLEERDAIIQDLHRRVSELEARLGTAPTPAPKPASPESARAAPSAPPRQPSVDETARSAPPSAASAEAEASQPPPQTAAAPGQFEVDEEAADRALERTLIQQGVLLLPTGSLEVQPSFLYTRNERAFPRPATGAAGQDIILLENVRRNELVGDLQLRFGLPFDSQIEFGVPYRYVDQSIVRSIGFEEISEVQDSGSGFGDIRVGLAKTLVREGIWWPDLVGRVTWDTATGTTSDGAVALGGGFNELGFSLSALRRQDPLAFSAGMSYEKAFEKDRLQPGNELAFTLGASLAASPETSMQLALRQSFIGEARVDGRSIDGSDQVLSQLVFGASTILGRRTLLTFSTNIGLTDDAPDYSVGLSLSRRFDLSDILWSSAAEPGG